MDNAEGEVETFSFLHYSFRSGIVHGYWDLHEGWLFMFQAAESCLCVKLARVCDYNCVDSRVSQGFVQINGPMLVFVL
jgi:hypothetical protein